MTTFEKLIFIPITVEPDKGESPRLFGAVIARDVNVADLAELFEQLLQLINCCAISKIIHLLTK